MSSSIKTPKCPRCGRPGKPAAGGLYRCPVGCGFFDSDPTEGGVAYNDPVKSAEKNEERERLMVTSLRCKSLAWYAAVGLSRGRERSND